MDFLTPLPVALPLLAAAVLAAGASHIPRRAADAAALLTAVAVLAINALLLRDAAHHPIVYWFGGWQPRHGVALGIAFVADPLAAGAAASAALLTVAALLFSWGYFEAVKTHYHALMLVFLAAMCGFCLTGDLFTLFVFLELMSVAAYALTAYKLEESSLEGGLNFGVTNSLGAFLVLAGIGLLYGRTGALNMAQIGNALAGQPADGLVLAALALILSGLLVKAAIAPFHFWLPDAHAVAPTPVCVLFSGIMVALGLYGAARLYWTVFEGALAPHEPQLRAILAGFGVLTAGVGAVMCYCQRHLKRLLAFSTVSHSGLLLLGMALLQPRGLAGAAIYVAGHGMVKGALFLGAGILLHRFSSVDELELRGKGRGLIPLACVFLVGGLALAGLPPFGTFLGKTLIEEQAKELGYAWLPWLLLAVAIITGGAVLRAAARVFLGWGEEEREVEEAPIEPGKPETEGARRRTPAVMLAPALGLLLLAGVLGLAPRTAVQAERSARLFQSREAYAAQVLEGRPAEPPARDEAPLKMLPGVLFGLAGAVGALLLPVLTLRRRLPQGSGAALRPLLRGLRSLHTGHVGDYVTWLVAGAACLGGLFAAMLR